MVTVKTITLNVDLLLLRRQKLDLVRASMDKTKRIPLATLDGILHLIDGVQDAMEGVN